MRFFWDFQAEDELRRAIGYVKAKNPGVACEMRCRLRSAEDHLVVFYYRYIIRYRINESSDFARIPRSSAVSRVTSALDHKQFPSLIRKPVGFDRIDSLHQPSLQLNALVGAVSPTSA